MALQEIGFKAVVDLSQYNKGLQVFNKGLRSAGEATTTMTKSANNSLSTLGKSMTKVGSVASGAFKLGMASAALGVVGLGVAVGGLAKSGIEAAISMEQSIADIRTTFSSGAPSVEKLQGLITGLGIDPKLKVSATEAASSIELLARNGLSWQEIADGAAKSSILLANATGADFGDAANVATDVMALFNIEAKDMEKAVNGITAVTVNSKFGFNDYALALANGGSAAANLGVSFDDFNTAIAAVSSNFDSGAQAGTSMRTLIQTLVPKTKSATEEMKRLGLITEDGSNRFFDAQGNMKGMAEVAGILQTTFGDLSDAQLSEAAATIFGQDALSAMLGLVQTGEEDFLELQAAMTKTNAANIVAERMNTLSGTLEVLGGLFETFQISIGNAFLPALRALADTMLQFAGENNEVVLPFFNRLGELLGKGIPLAINTLGAVWNNILSPAFTMVGGLLNNFIIPAFLSVSNIITSNLNAAVEAASSLWNIKLGTTFKRIGSLISNFLIPSILDLSKLFKGDLQEGTDNLTTLWVSKLFPAFEKVNKFLVQSVIPSIIRLTRYIRDDLPSVLQNVSSFITDTVIPAFTVFSSFIFDTAIPSIIELTSILGTQFINTVTALSSVWESSLLPALTSVINFINTSVFPTIKTLAGIFLDNLPSAMKVTTDFWTGTLLPTLASLITFTINTLTPVISGLIVLFKVTLPIALNTASVAWNIIKSIMGGVSEFVKDNLFPIFSNLHTWFITNLPIMEAAFLTAWTVINGIIETVGKAITEKIIPNLILSFNNIKEIVGSLGIEWGTVWEAIATATTIVATLVGGLLLGIIAGIVALVTAVSAALVNITSAFSTLSNLIVTNLALVSDALSAVTSFIKNVMVGEWRQAFNDIMDLGNILTESITIMFMAIFTIIDLTLGSVLLLVGTFIDSFIDFFVNLADVLVGNSIIPDMMNAIFNVIATSFMSILSSIGTFVASTIQAFTNLGSNLIESVSNTVGAIVNTFTSVDWIQIGAGIIQGVLAGVNALKNSLTSTFTAIAEGLKTAFTNINFNKLGSDIAKGIADGIKANAGKIKDALTKAASEGLDGIKALLGIGKDNSSEEAAQRIGKPIAQGLADGITTNSSLVTDALANMADDGIDEVKDILKISSPSKVFFNIGNDITSGLARGIEDGSADVIENTQNLVGGIFDSFTNAGNAFTSQLTSNMLDTRDNVTDISKSLSDIGRIATRALQSFSDEEVKLDVAGFEKIQNLIDFIRTKGFDLKDVFSGLNLQSLSTDELVTGLKNFTKGIITNVESGLKTQLVSELKFGDFVSGLEKQVIPLDDLVQPLTLRGTAGTFKGLFQTKLLDPLAKAIIAKDKEILLSRERLLAEPSGGYVDFYKTVLGAETEQRLRLTDEFLTTQKKLAGLQVPQDRINFLEKQLSLTNLIKKEGLDTAEILGDITLGETVSPLALLTATERALDGIVLKRREELALAQEKVTISEEELALQTAQANLASEQKNFRFLQAQQRALEDITRLELDSDTILGGFEVGVEASQTGFLGVMTRITQAMQDQVKEDLGIASPSKVFAEFGMQTGAGFEQGLRQSIAGVNDATIALIDGTFIPTSNSTTSNRSQTNSNNTTTNQFSNSFSVDGGSDLLSRIEDIVTNILTNQLSAEPT